MRQFFHPKKWASAAGPWLELLQAVLFLAFGILTLADGSLAFQFLQIAAAGALSIAGIARFLQLLPEGKPLPAILSLAGFGLLAVLAAVYPAIFTLPAGIVFGLWFLLSGLARGAIAAQCWVENLPGKFRNSFASLLSLVFGVLLIADPSMQLPTVFSLAGVYLILYAVSLLVDFISSLFLSNQLGDRVKRKVRIALPMFVTAFLPSRLIDEFNQYFLTHQDKGGVLRETQEPGEGKPALEVFIHLSDQGFGRMGHVDIRLDDTVYSYGCYDHHSHRFFGMVSDGTVAVAPAGPYLRHCLSFERKVLVGFGLHITHREREIVESKLRELSQVLVPWQSDWEKKQAGLTVKRKGPDPASRLVKATGAKIFKVKSGPFRKYFAINTNCVQLADTIIGPAGLDILRVNAIATPGSYFSMLNEMFERGNTIVTQRTIYADKKRGRTLAKKLEKKNSDKLP